jgi:hypothetical protein
VSMTPRLALCLVVSCMHIRCLMLSSDC